MFKKFSALVLASFLVAPLAHATDITVFAAASMKNALDEIGAVYKTKSGNGIVATYAATARWPNRLKHWLLLTYSFQLTKLGWIILLAKN